jgi:purine-binding chemotaxis protein CheW
MSIETTRQLVVFAVGGEECAVPITRVQEIIDYVEPRSVASENPWIRGVISLRGKILAVWDLAARLGVERTHDGTTKIVIVESGDDMAGIIVDEVTEVLTVDAGQVDAVPGASTALIAGIAKVGDRLVILLDLDGVFDTETVDSPAVIAA